MIYRIRCVELVVITLTFLALPLITHAQTGDVQGYKVNTAGGGFTFSPPARENVVVDSVGATTSQPFIFSGIPSGPRNLGVTVPEGWTVGHTGCYNSSSCHTQTPPPGTHVTVDVPAGGFADIWWHYSIQAPAHALTKIFDATLDTE